MPSVHAIILNYKRRDNIGRIVRACLNATRIDTIHVIDQAEPDQQLQMLPASRRLTARRARNIGAGRRLLFAAGLSCDLVIAIDDDLFLSASQITELIARSLKDSVRTHGVWGQQIVDIDGSPRMSFAIKNTNRLVDVLNRAYAFTPGHARNALQIADSLGLQRDNLGPVDDILLSFGAPSRPMCHDVGILTECRTSNQTGVAVWRQKGFERTRVDTIAKLRAVGRSWGEI